MDTLSQCLQDDSLKENVKKAWTIVGKLVSESMISDHYSGDSQTNLNRTDDETKHAYSQMVGSHFNGSGKEDKAPLNYFE